MRRAKTAATISRRSMVQRVAAIGATTAGIALLPNVGRAAMSGPTSVPFGVTAQGRPLFAVRIGDGPVRVMLLGGIHTGEEINTVDLVGAFVAHFAVNPSVLPAALSLLMIPVLNVDGVNLGTRINAHAIDLNRNWPARWQPVAQHASEIVSGGTAPLSEPETTALYNLIRTFRPHALLSWHSAYPPAGEAEGNTAALSMAAGVTGKTLAHAFAAGSGFDYLETWIAYPITGQLLDTLTDLGIPGLDIELPAYGDTFFDKNLAGLQGVLDQLMTALR